MRRKPQAKYLMICWGCLLTLFLLSEGKAAQSLFYQPSVRYATGFRIDYYDTYKLITVRNPWKGANVTYRYLLVQRGTTPPSGYGDIPQIEIPLRSIVTMSTTHLVYLDSLGLLKTLVGFNTFDFINTPAVLERIAAGKIKEVGGGESINIELLMDLDPEVIMTYSLGNASDVHFKILEAGLQVVINAEYMEPTPLGRAEWIKFLSAFFNKEQDAEAMFAKVVRAYEQLAAKTTGLTEKPTVFLNAPYNGNWWIPGGNTYLTVFLKDAGATYLWEDLDTQGSMLVEFEAIYEKAADADFWLHPGQWDRLQDGLAADERLAQFAAFRQAQVYNNNARENPHGGNDFWESGLTRPDIILADLMKIFHPDLVPDHELVYYKHLK